MRVSVLYKTSGLIGDTFNKAKGFVFKKLFNVSSTQELAEKGVKRLARSYAERTYKNDPEKLKQILEKIENLKL